MVVFTIKTPIANIFILPLYFDDTRPKGFSRGLFVETRPLNSSGDNEPKKPEKKLQLGSPWAGFRKRWLRICPGVKRGGKFEENFGGKYSEGSLTGIKFYVLPERVRHISAVR